MLKRIYRQALEAAGIRTTTSLQAYRILFDDSPADLPAFSPVSEKKKKNFRAHPDFVARTI
jgi:hypothetical protein